MKKWSILTDFCLFPKQDFNFLPKSCLVILRTHGSWVYRKDVEPCGKLVQIIEKIPEFLVHE